MGFKLDINSLEKGIKAFDDKADAAFRLYAETSALKLQSDAKINARWVDRTGEARRRLKCTVNKEVRGYRLTLAHGVDYGTWLELANEKKYAIIETTIRFTGTFDIMPGFNKLIERLNKAGR